MPAHDLIRCGRRGEVAIGYCRAQRDGADGRRLGVVVNPVKSRAVQYQRADRFIVLAKD